MARTRYRAVALRGREAPNKGGSPYQLLGYDQVMGDTLFEAAGLPGAQSRHREWLAVRGLQPPGKVNYQLVVAIIEPHPSDRYLGVALARILYNDDQATTRAKLLALAVDPKCRKKGLGQRLWASVHHACFQEAQRHWREVKYPGDLAFDPGVEEATRYTPAFALLAVLNGHKLLHTPLVVQTNANYTHKLQRARESSCTGGESRTREPLSESDLRSMSGDSWLQHLEGDHTTVALGGAYLSTRPIIARLSPAEFTHPRLAEGPNGLPLMQNVRITLKSLPFVMNRKVLPSQETGLLQLVLDEKPCCLLDEYLESEANYSNQVTSSKVTGVNHINCLKVGVNKYLAGYDEYEHVNRNDTFNPYRQASTTKRTNNHAEVLLCLNNLPGLREIAEQALKKLGVHQDEMNQWLYTNLKAMHFLLLDWSRQTTFDWHVDHQDLKLTIADATYMLSVIVQLSPSMCTGMQMYGFNPATYRGRGACCAFHGAAVHRSTPLHPKVVVKGCLRVWKVALFFRP